MTTSLLGIGLFLGLTLGVSCYFGRTRSAEDFLIANRNLGVFSSLMTIVASKIGAGMVLTYLAYIYRWGPISGTFFVGNIIGYLAFIPLGAYLRRQSESHRFYTLPDYYRHRFGPMTGMTMGIIQFFLMAMSVTLQLVGGAHIISDLGVAYPIAVISISGVVLIYLLLGGFRSVVATDILQGLALLVLVPLFVYLAFSYPTEVPLRLESSPEGIRNAPNFIIMGLVLPFATPELWQRVFATGDVSRTRKTLFSTALLFGLFGGLLTLVGLRFSGIVQDIKPELLLIRGFELTLPGWMSALGGIFLLAAVMSSFDTYVYTASSIFVQDILGRGDRSKALPTVRRIQGVQLFIVTAASCLALAVPDLIDVSLLAISLTAVCGVVGIGLAIRRERLSDPIFALGLGVFGAGYAIVTRGLDPALVSFGAGGALAGLLIRGAIAWIWSRASGPGAGDAAR